MEELIKLLDIMKINYMIIDYTDNDGNFKQLELDYRKESKDK